MKVRGITLLTRKAIITQWFGADAWATFFRDIATAHPLFAAPVTATTLVPLPMYLAFHDELVRRFFGDTESAHIELGKESARRVTLEPYKGLLTAPEINRFVSSIPKLWKMYFADTTSRSETALSGSTVDFKVSGLPVWHRYLEHFVLGYISEVLELYCANPIAAARVGKSGTDFHYVLSTAPAAKTSGGEQPLALGGSRRGAVVGALTEREMEILLLVAEGKTNNEIGMALEISGKTVQHHLAHAYGKLGVSGRVDAALWLAQRGLIGR